MNFASLNWAVRHLLVVTLAAALSAQADTLVRVSSFEYDNSATGVFTAGLLTREVIEPLGGNPGAGTTANDCLQTSYSYDAYGNKTGASTEPCADATGYAISSAPVGIQRSATSTFAAQSLTINSVTYTSPAGAFPTTSTNALSQSETKTYDPRFGAVASLTGPNGLTTTWAYDGFGRKTRETRADGTYTTWTYKLCTDSDANCPGAIAGAVSNTVAIEQSHAVTAVASAPAKRQYHDTLGRVVRVETQGFDGGAGAVPTLYQDTKYNALGQVESKSNLYQSTGTAVWASYTYDALGRLTSESHLDTASTTATPTATATTSFAYNALVTTVTDAKGQSKITTKNAQGQVAQVTDALNNTVTYSFDALGQLLSTNAAGSITSMSYNQRGQKIAMLDPAMGHWVYAYNVFGELVYQRDSLNQSVTMEYDKLGRMTKRTEPDLVSQWSYDAYANNSACDKGIGKLCEATTTNGYNRKHNYDPMGRAIRTDTLLDASTSPVTSATVSVAYDASTGRVASKTYPGNYQVRYTYTGLGYLKSVAGGVTTSGFTQNVSYEVQAMNAQGQITQYQYGSELGKKIVTTRNFDANTGRLMGQGATQDGQAAGNVLSHVYDYDKLGNVTLRNDATVGVNTQEAFSYDSLNRLSTATISGGAVSATRRTDVLYDARGNISYKSNVGTYWYDAARPNRMTNVTLEVPAGADALNFTGTRALSYAYDDYRANAQLINGTTVGNGNLEYAVTHDAGPPTGGVLRHNVRWESYTSFNMPNEIKFGNLLPANACLAGYVLIATNCVKAAIPLPVIAATATYTCPSGGTVSGSNCVNGATTTPATLSYGCQAEYVLMNVASCVHPELVGNASAAQASYSCVQGTLAGTNCVVDNVSTPASVSYGCGAGLTMAGQMCITTSALSTVTAALQTAQDRTLAFVYGPEHQRIKQTVTLSGTGTSAYFAGSTWYLNGEDGQGLTYEREVRTNNTIEERYYINAGGVVFAMFASRSGTLNGLSAAKVNYMHHDQLGSVAVVTGGAGTVTDRLAYDPWGKRRNINANVGNPDVGDAIVGAMTDRGYTMHEHLDEMGVIHMNGRVYDPLLGRFMSADPFIQSPDNLQSYNRYSYVLNNPLYFTDPSGYSWWTRLRRIVIKVVAAVADVYGCGGYCSASVGAYNGAKNGGGLTGALVGAVTGYAGAQYAGNFSPEAFAVSAASGCANAAAHGGSCGRGAIASSIDTYGSQYGLTGQVVSGCLGAYVSGGKCGHGAADAAMTFGVRYVIAGAAADSHRRAEAEAYRANSTANAGVVVGGAGLIFILAAADGQRMLGLIFSGAGPEALANSISNGARSLWGVFSVSEAGADKPAATPTEPSPDSASAADKAKELGYDRKVKDPPFNPHGQPVFTNGKDFITPDADQHNGGEWKGFDRRGNRTGTYDGNLDRIGK